MSIGTFDAYVIAGIAFFATAHWIAGFACLLLAALVLIAENK